MVVGEVKVATGVFIVYIFILFYFVHSYKAIDIFLILWRILGLLIILLISSRLPHSEVVKRSALLGIVCGIGLFLSFFSCVCSSWRCFGWYLSALSFFHFSEYVITGLYNADKLSVDSFLLNHSLEYKVAALASWIEFLVELHFSPMLKAQFVVSLVGLIMVMFGETLRKVAMVTAKSNFTHLVQYRKRDGHVLVTWGIYSWCRHPSYVGWFWWSIGTQLILCNPVCFIAYVVASWKFFKERIWEEEIILLEFFGEDYIDYQRKVGTGLPFISGFKIDENVHVQHMKTCTNS